MNNDSVLPLSPMDSCRCSNGRHTWYISLRCDLYGRHYPGAWWTNRRGDTTRLRAS